MDWLIAMRESPTAEWRSVGTTRETPSSEIVHRAVEHGHTPNFREYMFSERGVEVRFLPVSGGADPIVFTAGYELTIAKASSAAEADREAEAASVPSLDPDDLTTPDDAVTMDQLERAAEPLDPPEITF